MRDHDLKEPSYRIPFSGIKEVIWQSSQKWRNAIAEMLSPIIILPHDCDGLTIEYNNMEVMECLQ